jgi:hypothetical protein
MFIGFGGFMHPQIKASYYLQACFPDLPVGTKATINKTKGEK